MEDAVERAGNLQTAAIDAACDLLEQKNYGAVQRVLLGTLPQLADDAYEERVRIYMLLLALPDHPVNRGVQEDGLRVARHIFQHCEQFSLRYRLWAHMLFGSWQKHSSWDTERNEFFALRDAQEVLAYPEASREDRDCALTLIAAESLDRDQVRLCLEELFRGANVFAITHACTMVPVAFHRETNLQYLDRALEQVQRGPPGFVADILRKKMAVILEMLEENTEAGMLDRKAFHVQLTTCYANLRMIPQAMRHQAYSEYYLGYAAAYLNETEIGLIHTYTAIAMARQLGLTHLEKLACAVRDHLQSRAPYEGDQEEHG